MLSGLPHYSLQRISRISNTFRRSFYTYRLTHASSLKMVVLVEYLGRTCRI